MRNIFFKIMDQDMYKMDQNILFYRKQQISIKKKYICPMGNSASTACSLQQLQRIQLSPQQLKNINLYVWRASSLSNQYISRVKLNISEKSILKKQSFICSSVEEGFNPHITFEEYVCDMTPLKSFLNVSELLTVLRSVLKGHETIFRKFGASIVSQKCSFITVNGEFRTWINPNYYLNEFWQIPKKQFRLTNSLTSELNNQTPRFMNKNQYEFKKVPYLTSEPTLTRKIIEFMRQFSKNCVQSWKFWTQIEYFVSKDILSNCNFAKIQTFINNFVYQNKIILKSSILDVVKRLISERIIMTSEKNSMKTLKQKKKNKNASGDLGLISVLNVKNLRKNTKEMSTSNLNCLNIGVTPNYEGLKNIELKRVSFEASICQNSNKLKLSEQRSKISKSLVKSGKIVNSTMRQQADARVQLQALHFNNVNSRQSLWEKLRHQKPVRNLTYSCQYSINLHSRQTPQIQKYSKYNSTQPISQRNQSLFYVQNSILQSDQVKTSENSQRSSILKKENNTQSSEIERIFSNFSCEKRLNNHKKHSLFEKSEQNDSLGEKKISKQLRFSNLVIKNPNQITDKNSTLTKAFQQNASTLKIDSILEGTKGTSIKIKQNSNFRLQNIEQSPLHQNKPFHEITNCKESINFFGIDKNAGTEKCFNSNGRFLGNFHRGPASMLIDLRQPDNQAREELHISKRRISVRYEGKAQLQINGLSPNNRIGADQGLTPRYTQRRTQRVISKLFSSSKNLQKSIGFISQFEESQKDSKQSKYSGILTKLGRSATLIKVPPQEMPKIHQIERAKILNTPDIMPNFNKKKTIDDYSSNRSMKI